MRRTVAASITLLLACSAAEGAAQERSRVMHEVEAIEASLRETRYQHATRVDVARGRYRFDCSGMVNWILRRSAPRAFRALGRPRPVAATYARTIARAPSRPRGAWQRIDRWQDVRPGDVFAFESTRIRGLDRWLRLFTSERQPSGHTGIVVSSMRPVALGVVEAEIVDSTTFPHGGDDRRAWGGEGGFGRGTMAFHWRGDEIVGHGWLGATGPILWNQTWIGRPRR